VHLVGRGAPAALLCGGRSSNAYRRSRLALGRRASRPAGATRCRNTAGSPLRWCSSWGF